MATRQMIGKIAREDSLAIHSRASPMALWLYLLTGRAKCGTLPCALRCVGAWPKQDPARESPNVIEFLLVTSYSPVWHYLPI